MRLLNIAEGSAEECRYYLILAKDLGYVGTDNPMETLDQTARLLSACIKALSTTDYCFYVARYGTIWPVLTPLTSASTTFSS